MKGYGNEYEMIEGYLLNQLSPSQKALFEAAITKDPLLKAEISVQKDIIGSLQNFRKAELKARLNNIQPPAAATSNYFKIAASVLLILAGTSGYFYLNQNKEEEKTEMEIAVTTKPAPETVTPAEEIMESIKSEEAVTVSQPKIETPASKPTERDVKTQTKSVSVNPVVPLIPDSFEDIDVIDKNVSLPEASVSQSTDTKTKNLEVNVVKSETISYKYYNNKLFLYGEFSSSPYELLELNSHKGRELYLYHSDNYYLLKPNTLESSPLKPLADTSVKIQLDGIRGK